mgnify:CR=1 FL=1
MNTQLTFWLIKGTVIYQVGRENVVSLMSIAQESVLAYDRQAYKNM